MAERTLRIEISVDDKGTVKLKQFGGAMDSTVKKTGTLKQGFTHLESAAQRMERRIFSVRSALLTLAGGYGLGMLTRSFVDAASTAEQYQIRLNALLGSTREGSRLFKEMADFAGKVPFEYREIMGSATALAGVMEGGVEEIKQWMPMIADLAAVSGLTIQDTTSQVIRMYSAGAAAADMFRERGILSMLGFQAGVSYSAEETRKRLIEAWESPLSKFRGASEELGKSWQGLTSMLSDAWFQFRTDVMEAGVFDLMKSGLEDVLDRIKKLKEEGKLEEYVNKTAETTIHAMGHITQTSAGIIGFFETKGIAEYGLIGFIWKGYRGAAVGMGLAWLKEQIPTEEDVRSWWERIKDIFEEEAPVMEFRMEKPFGDVEYYEHTKSAMAGVADELNNMAQKMLAFKVETDNTKKTLDATQNSVNRNIKSTRDWEAGLEGITKQLEKMPEYFPWTAEGIEETLVDPWEKGLEDITAQCDQAFDDMVADFSFLKDEWKDTNDEMREISISVWYDIRQVIWDFLNDAMRDFASFKDFMAGILEAISRSMTAKMAEITTNWLKKIGQMKLAGSDLLTALAGAVTVAGIGIAGGAGGGEIATTTAATAAMLAGHPEIAVAVIGVANISRAVFKGNVEYVQTGAVAAGMAPSTIGMEKTWWGMGYGMGWLEELSDIFFGWMGGIFSRKWPTVRGQLKISLDEIDAWFTELRDVKVDEEAVLREFRSWLQSVVDMYLGWIDLLPADVTKQLKESLPAIEIPFAAGRKDMELLAQKFATQVILETYLSWGRPILEELNKALGVDLSKIFELPDVSGILEMVNRWGWISADLERAKELWEEDQREWTGQIESLQELYRLFEHNWSDLVEDLYEYTTRVLLPTFTAAVQYGFTMKNLIEKYGKAIGETYMEDSAAKVKEIVDRYIPQIEAAAEEDVQKLAEEMGKTIEEYLSALVSFVSEIEDTIAKYTMPEPAFELWELENWFKDMAAQAEALGLTSEEAISRLDEALARRFFKPIEDSLDTRSEYEKARADIEEWYWAHLAFFEAHREMLEALGYSIEDIINAYNKLLEQLEEARQERIAEAFDRIRSIVEEFTIGAEELAGIGMERLRGRWLDRSLEYYREHWDELMADAQEYMNLEIELYELRKNKLIEETEAVIAGYRDRMAELEDLKREWESVAQSAASAINELRFGSTAGLRPVEAWPLIRAEYERLKAAALTSPEAAREFLEFYPTYLEYARDMYKSSEAYQLILADVLSVLEFIQTYAEDQVSELEAQTRALESAITSAELALENALEALRVETADRLQAVSDWLSEILAAINAIEQPDINITVTTGTGTATTVAGQPQNVVMGAISGVKYPHAPGRLPMQEGGIVTEPILAQLHPQEAVIPLDRGKINVDMDFDYDRFAKAVRIDEEKLAKALARELEGGPPKTIILRLEPREFKRWFRKASENREVIIGE